MANTGCIGESDFVNLAWSENLYDWYPLVDSARISEKNHVTTGLVFLTATWMNAVHLP